MEGEEWKNGDKPMLTPELARKYKEHSMLLLVSVSCWNGIQEVRVTAISPCGGYVKLALGPKNNQWGGLNALFAFPTGSGEEGNWVNMMDVQVLSVLRRDIATSPVELEVEKKKKGTNDGFKWGIGGK